MSLITFDSATKDNNFVATLKLNRPDKLNALSWDLLEDLKVGLKAARADSHLRCLLIGSTSPKAFCAGADLKERLQMTEEKVVETLERLQAVIDELDSIPAPTLAVLEGLAFGGGLELALACDFRVAAPSAQLGLTESSLAIIPGAGGTQRLPRLIGEAKAKELIYFAKKLSGADAEKIGLVMACDNDPWKLATSLATELSQKGPLALQLAKKSIARGRAQSLSDALATERNCYLELLSSTDRTEGLQAFVEKRTPTYKGR